MLTGAIVVGILSAVATTFIAGFLVGEDRGSRRREKEMTKQYLEQKRLERLA